MRFYIFDPGCRIKPNWHEHHKSCLVSFFWCQILGVEHPLHSQVPRRQFCDVKGSSHTCCALNHSMYAVLVSRLGSIGLENVNLLNPSLERHYISAMCQLDTIKIYFHAGIQSKNYYAILRMAFASLNNDSTNSNVFRPQLNGFLPQP